MLVICECLWIMDIRRKSGCKVDLDDILGNSIQHVFLALAHPVPELSEVDFISRSLLLFKVLMENDLEVLQIVENVVESMADDQHRERVVQLVAFLVGLVLQSLAQNAENVDC